MTDILFLIFAFLFAGVVSVPIATRLGLGSVLGYLIAGILLTPLLRFMQVDVVSLQHFAEFGVVMMLFLVGLELEPERLWRMRNKLLGLGGLQVLLSAALIFIAGLMFGLVWSVALAVGLVLALSSTAIVLQTLNEKGLFNSDGGQSAFSVLLFQDIAVIPMIALLPLLAMPELTGIAASGGSGHHGMSLVHGLPAWQATLITVAAVAAVVVGGARLIAPLFNFIAVSQLRELFTAAALMVVIGIALLMSLVGLSPALGTFIAGVVLANSHYRHELESDIEPFKGLLLGLFFMTVGAGINFALMAEQAMTIVGLTLLLMAVKAVVLLLLATVFGLRGADRWLCVLGLAQAGEFGFVLLSLTVASGVIPQPLSEQLLLVVAMSMLLTPMLFIVYDKVIAPRYAHKQERKADSIDAPSDILIAGHGRFGGVINRMLRGLGYETTVLDYNAGHLELLRRFGVKVYYGDATRPDLLHAAGIEKAKVFVIAINGREETTRLTQYVIENYPQVHVIARAWDRNHVFELWAVGCRDIIRETYDSSIRSGRSALAALGVPEDEACKLSKAFESVDRSLMREMAGLYRIDQPNHENPEYVAKVREMHAQWGRMLRGEADKIRNGATTQD